MFHYLRFGSYIDQEICQLYVDSGSYWNGRPYTREWYHHSLDYNQAIQDVVFRIPLNVVSLILCDNMYAQRIAAFVGLLLSDPCTVYKMTILMLMLWIYVKAGLFCNQSLFIAKLVRQEKAGLDSWAVFVGCQADCGWGGGGTSSRENYYNSPYQWRPQNSLHLYPPT